MSLFRLEKRIKTNDFTVLVFFIRAVRNYLSHCIPRPHGRGIRFLGIKTLFKYVGIPLYFALVSGVFIIGAIINSILLFARFSAEYVHILFHKELRNDHVIYEHSKERTKIFIQNALSFFKNREYRLKLWRVSTIFRIRLFMVHPFFRSRPILFFHQVWLPLSILCIVILSGLHATHIIYVSVFEKLPTANDLRSHTPALTTRIYDRNGILLYSLYKDENRSLVKLSDLPAHLPNAFISIEDKEFYEHKGISFRGLVRVARNLFFEPGKKVQGASTITQQLIKNTILTNERTLARKMKEMFIAVQVERTFSKDEILQMYLNEVSFGGSLYGVEEASKAYFGKSAKNLTIAESAFLAGLPAAPSIYTPYGNHLELSFLRQHEVLRRMFEDKKITPLEYEQAKSQKLTFVENRTDIKAPHFVMYVRELLAKEFGEHAIAQGGLEIYTTLDLPLQNKVQTIVKKEVDSLANLHIGNGAALVTNPMTGEILAMVGSKNYFDTKNDGQVNVTIRPRQPGSSIKPVTYAAAFERGYTPATVIDDAPLVISIPGAPPYSPKNYDSTYHGKVTIRRSLASSYNIPAVKTLMNIGVSNLVEKGKQMGITTWDNSTRFGLSLTLGSGETLMTDMSVVYGTFANGGTTVPLQFIKEIKDSSGKTITFNPCINTKTPCGGKKTLDPRIAYQITSILSDNSARAPAFGMHSVLTIPGQEVAVKTGTTNGLRDNWTIGYTSNKLVATWVGNNDNTPMSRVTSGIIGASPIWAKIMKEVLDPSFSHHFLIPEGLVAKTICAYTGTAWCGDCGAVYTEYFLPGTEPANECATIASQTEI